MPGRSLGGIALGWPIRSVIARLGPPSEVGTSPEGAVYIFSRFGIIVRGQDTVRTVSTTNGLLYTKEQIRLGSSEADVIAAYGQQFTRAEVEGVHAFEYQALGIAFGIDRGAVSVISIFPPRPSARRGD